MGIYFMRGKFYFIILIIMSEKEVKLFTVFLQKIDEKIWTDKMDRLLWYLIGTFNKQYDREEERDSIIETITEYLSWWAHYIDEQYKENEEYEIRSREKKKEEKEIIDSMRKVISYFKNWG